jgi:hypothetical protein
VPTRREELRVPTLREIEAAFFGLLTAPEDVARTLAATGRSAADVEALIVGDGRRSAVARLDLYANMYFFRLLDALAEDFATLRALLGADRFHNLVTDYLQAYPSEHPSLRQLGARLPAFLDGRAPPWHAELARLEWARLQVFDAPDAAPLTLEALRALAPEAFAALPLRTVPAHARLRLRFAVDEPWQAVADGRVPADPPEAPRTLLVWRQDLTVYHRALDAEEDAALDALAGDGLGFGALCELLAPDRPDEEAAQRAFLLLSRWVDHGLVAA